MIRLKWKLVLWKEETKASFLYDIRKDEQLPLPVVFCNIKRYAKSVVFVISANIVRFPSNLLYSYITGSDERIIKFRIDRTGSDVIMATESFSYIIHCNFEIKYLRNARCYRNDICCDNMICRVEAFCGAWSHRSRGPEVTLKRQYFFKTP